VSAGKIELPAPFTWEVATVYRSHDGRRFLTKRSAMFHSAIVFLRDKRCTCFIGRRSNDADNDKEDCWAHGWNRDAVIKSAQKLVKFWKRKEKGAKP
jgi:hypothetical protein